MKGMRLRPASAPFASSPANQAEDKLPRTVGWLMPIDPASPSSRPRTAPSAQTPSRLPFGGSPSGGASVASGGSRRSGRSARSGSARSRSPPAKRELGVRREDQPGRKREVMHGWRPRTKPKPLDDDQAPLDHTLARWIKSYNSEQTVFASDFLSAEVKLREAATTTETLRLGGEYVPPRNLAIVTCDVLLSIAKQFGRFEGLMNLVACNVMRCVFPPRTDPSALADGASGDGAIDEPPAKGTDLVYMVPWYEMWRTAVQEQRRLGHVVHERDEGVAMREAVQKKTKLVAQLLDSNVHFRLKVSFRAWSTRFRRDRVQARLSRRRAAARLAPRYFALWTRFAAECVRAREVEQYRLDIVDLLDAEQEKREELNEAYDALLETNKELEAQREVLGQELTLEKEKVEKAAKSSRKKHVDKVVGRARVSFANRARAAPAPGDSAAQLERKKTMGLNLNLAGAVDGAPRRPSIVRATAIRQSMVAGGGGEGGGRIAALATPFAADFDYKDNPAFNWAKKNKLRNTREVGSSTLQALRLRNACDSRFLQASRDAQTELPGGGPLAAWERRGDERKGRRERDRRRDAAAKKFGGSITAKHRPFGSGHSGPAARRTHQIKDRAELDVDQCLELASDALVEKVRQDAEDRVLHQPFQHLRPYFMDYLLRRYGVRALATKFRRAVEKCVEQTPPDELHPRLRVFALLYGLKLKEEEAGEAFAASTADLRGSAASPPRGSSPAKADGAGEAKKPKPKKRKNKDRGGGRRPFNQNVDDREGVVQFFTELILSCVGTSEDFKELLDDAFEEPLVRVADVFAGVRVAFRSLRAKAPRAYYDEILRDAVLGHGDVSERLARHHGHGGGDHTARAAAAMHMFTETHHAAEDRRATPRKGPTLSPGRMPPKNDGLAAKAAMRFESAVPLDAVLERLVRCWPLEKRARHDRSPEALETALRPALRLMRRTVVAWRATRESQTKLARRAFRRADALIHADEYSPRGVFSYAEFEELVQDHCKLADVDRQDATFLFKRWHELCDIRGTAARLPRDERTEEAFLNDIRDPTARRAALEEMRRVGDNRSAEATEDYFDEKDDGERALEAMRFELDEDVDENESLGDSVEVAARMCEANLADVEIASRAFADTLWMARLRLGADLAPEKDGDADSFASTVSRANRSPSPPRPSRAGRLK